MELTEQTCPILDLWCVSKAVPARVVKGSMAEDVLNASEWELQSAAMLEADRVYNIPCLCEHDCQAFPSQPKGKAKSTNASNSPKVEGGAARPEPSSRHIKMGHGSATQLLQPETAAFDPSSACLATTPAITTLKAAAVHRKSSSTQPVCSSENSAGSLATLATGTVQPTRHLYGATAGTAMNVHLRNRISVRRHLRSLPPLR